MDERSFDTLVEYLARIPSIKGTIGNGTSEDGNWWVKFAIDLHHELAWKTIQELGFVLNYLSVEERLPTVFAPVSPPPYLNGGPDEFLSWIIESRDPKFRPGTCKKWLEARLPNPVDDPAQWINIS